MDKTNEPHDYLTTHEVAELLRVKERKVYDLANAGEIPCRRVTGKLLFPRREIDLWLNNEASPFAHAQTLSNVIAGSHDPLLEWAIRESGCGLATLFDGSVDGLEKIATGAAICIGMHVFEPAAGTWNVTHVRERLGSAPLVLFEWARRQQGLIVRPELVAEIHDVRDLKNRRVMRRQEKAGGSILFRHLLEKAGMTESDIDFAGGIARTEVDAAAAVAGGQADAAPGLQAMARQFGMGFAPGMMERFDLLVDRRSWFEPPMQNLLRFARSDTFVQKACEFGGYDLSGFGTVQWNGA